MADVFISYSRKDKEFVTKLRDALKAPNRDAWVDLDVIRPSAEWLREVYAGIEESNLEYV